MAQKRVCFLCQRKRRRTFVRRRLRLVRFLFKSGSVFALYDGFEHVFKATECFVDDFIRICHRGVQAATCERNDTVCHVGCAHLLHSDLSSEHLGFLFEHRDDRTEQGHIGEVIAHCARAFEVNDAALVVYDVRKVVFLYESFEACRKTIACFAGNFARIVLFDLANSNLSCI